MTAFPRRSARRSRPLTLALHSNHTTSPNSNAAGKSSATQALRRHGGVASLALAAVFLLSFEDLAPLTAFTGSNNNKSAAGRDRSRNLRVMDSTNPEENLARPVDLPYDPTNPLLSRGERNLGGAMTSGSGDNSAKTQAEAKGWSVGDVFSRSSAGDYNDDGSGSHRSLSSGSDSSSGGGWFSSFGSPFGGAGNKFGGLGDDMRSIQEALDRVIMPSRRFLANWNDDHKRYLYEWTDGVTSEPVEGATADDEQDEDPRPIMHTFFDAISSKGLEDELALVAAWEAAWQSAGWRTKVLTGEDAKTHFQYGELWPLIDAMPLIQYDKLCYLRWLAMGATGGGWMSDYDTVPLRGSLERAVDLSYRPTFTVYGQNLSGDAVPALLSGSASEWNRMVNALVRLGPTAVETVGKFPFPSDMYSLMSLQYSDEVYFHVENDLMRGQDAFFSLVDGPDAFKCSKFNHLEMFEGQRVPDWRAIHFSHAALMDVNVGFNNIASYRPKFALRWNSLYRNKCLGEPMPGTQEEGGDPTPIEKNEAETESVPIVVESEVETSAEVLAQEEEANNPETAEALDAMEEIEQAITSQFEDAKAELEAQMQYAAAAAEQDAEAKANAEYEAFYNDQGKPARILEVKEEDEAAAAEGDATDSTRNVESEEPSTVSEGGRILTTTEAAEEPAATVPSVEGYKLPEGAMAPGSILERALAPDVPAAPVSDTPAIPVPEIPSDPSGERALMAEKSPVPEAAALETGNTDYLTPPVPSMPVPTM